jgi:hypothetical protein
LSLYLATARNKTSSALFKHHGCNTKLNIH